VAIYCAWEYTTGRFYRESFQRKRCDEVLPNVYSIVAAYDFVVPESGLPLGKARQLVKLLQEVGWCVSNPPPIFVAKAQEDVS
jgi:hypothetical protein